jgi:hypothetical protein
MLLFAAAGLDACAKSIVTTALPRLASHHEPAVRAPGQAAHDCAATKTMIHPKLELFVPKRTGVSTELRKLHHKLW